MSTNESYSDERMLRRNLDQAQQGLIAEFQRSEDYRQKNKTLVDKLERIQSITFEMITDTTPRSMSYYHAAFRRIRTIIAEEIEEPEDAQ